MPTTVESITINCNPINEKNTFTNGDIVSGQITLELAQDCQINSLSVKFKGKADVMWTERHVKAIVVYHSKDKYFSIKHFFIGEQKGHGEDYQTLLTDHNGKQYSNVVAPGCHVYPFTFQIPTQSLPSSFKGSCGKIVYSLEARLSRSMRIDSTASTMINFVSKADLNIVPGLMTPQHRSMAKKMMFNSGTVSMDVDLEKMGYFLGEGVNIVASIQNNLSREIKPKYCIYIKHSYFAKGKRRLITKDLFKLVGEPIPPSTNPTVTKVIHIPPYDVNPSILNCSIIKVEYRIRVWLDVKFAFNPVVKFPIVILPASPVASVEQPPADAGFGFQAFGNPNPPARNTAPQHPMAPQPLEPPPSYGAYGMYPSLSNVDKKY